MPKKKITIEIDIDEILGLLKSKDNVTLELTVTSEEDADEVVDEVVDEPTNDWIENLPPEQREEMRKKINWPF